MDFSSRKNLIVSLIPQLRLNSFNGPLLHKQLITAASEFHWADADAFVLNITSSGNSSPSRFFSWFLKWNVDPTVLQTYIVDAHDHAMTLVNQQLLITRSFKHSNNLTVYRIFTFGFKSNETSSSFRCFLHSSIKSQLLALLTLVAHIMIFAVLDAGLYEILPPLPDKPLERPAKVRHYYEMGYHDRYALLQLSPRYPPQLALIRAIL